MRRLIPIFVVVAAVVFHDRSIVGRAHAAAASSDITVSGEILDLACYIAHGGKGPDHQKCARKCAEQGQPIGLLESDGKVYILYADHAEGAPYDKARKLAGSRAEIKGEPASKDGIYGLTVHDVKKL